MRLIYGITPPKLSSSEQRRREIAKLQSQRINDLPVDALLIYDLQDESTRTSVERPFPFSACIDPLSYAYDYLADASCHKIVYRSVSGQSEESLTDWLKQLQSFGGATVLVGAPSNEQQVKLRLGDAYKLRRSVTPNLSLGGVAIAERHENSGDEDARILRKIVSVPKWLKNELTHAGDILEKSVDLSLSGFAELLAFAEEKGFQLGCNVESVSLHKAEIDASVEMVRRLAVLMRD